MKIIDYAYPNSSPKPSTFIEVLTATLLFIVPALALFILAK